jgi:hypothetical protein
MKVRTTTFVSIDRHLTLRSKRGCFNPLTLPPPEASNSMATNFLLISWKHELEPSVRYEISHYRGTTVRHLHYKILLQKSTPLCKCPFSIQKKEANPLFGALLINYVCVTVRILPSLSTIPSFLSSVLRINFPSFCDKKYKKSIKIYIHPAALTT